MAEPPDETVLHLGGERATGLVKCPHCGSTMLQITAESTTCTSCRSSWPTAAEMPDLSAGIDELHGRVRGAGAGDIDRGAGTLVTIKCQGCGAEIVLDTATTLEARCHWCRQRLSVGDAVANGALPDLLVPFTVQRAEAVARISQFVAHRRLLGRRAFVRAFSPENVVPVFIPHFAFDGNVMVAVSGEGGRARKKYWEGSEDNVVAHDVEVFDVTRSFRMGVDDLYLVSHSERADSLDRHSGNHVLHAILPYDLSQAVPFRAPLLAGATSERRDLNTDDATEVLEQDLSLLGRCAGLDLVDGQFDWGVRWDRTAVKLLGQRWVAVLVPVWMFSWHDRRHRTTHQIVMNAQNGKLHGSVPVGWIRTALAGAAITALLTAAMSAFMVFALSDWFDSSGWAWIPSLLMALPLGGCIFPWTQYRYRSAIASYDMAGTTRVTTSDVEGDETSNRLLTRTPLPRIEGAMERQMLRRLGFSAQMQDAIEARKNAQRGRRR